jgi:hypothetical protein
VGGGLVLCVLSDLGTLENKCPPESGSKIMNQRKTMKLILAETSELCARRSWQKAALVSRLRHDAVAAGNHHVARLLGAAKDRHILRAIELAGDYVRVVEATDDSRFYSVRFRGERIRALHLPKDRLLLGGAEADCTSQVQRTNYGPATVMPADFQAKFALPRRGKYEQCDREAAEEARQDSERAG